MSFATISYVNYYLNDNYYVVGNNATSDADGISSNSVSEDIVIQRSVNGKSVLEISRYAFVSCQITRVTIYAKLRSINTFAFCWCTKLKYINIPSSVTFVGDAALYLGTQSTTINLEMTIEFNPGRKKKIYIDTQCFSRRTTFYIIYPSCLAPLYDAKSTFYCVTNCFICTPTLLDFYNKNSTIDSSKCPIPQFKASLKEDFCSCNKIRRNGGIFFQDLLFFLLTN